MRLILTRPLDESTKLASQLAALGHETLVSPVIEIRNQPGVTVDLAGAQAILATSANGIRALAAAAAERAVPVYAVGPATAAAAQAAGYVTVHVAGGDVDALTDLVVAEADPAGGRLIHAAGTALAGDLKGSLEGRGFTVERIVLYEARPAERLTPDAVAAIRAGAFDGVMFFSPRTASNFVNLACDAGLADRFAGATAYCLSQTVSAGLGPLEFARLVIAEAPTEAALIAALDTIAAAPAPAPEAPEPEAPPPSDEPPPETTPETTPEADFTAAPQLDPPLETAPPRRPRRSMAWGMAVLLVIVVAIGAGWLWQNRQDLISAGPGVPILDPGFAGRLAAVEQAEDSLARRLAALEAHMTQTADRAAPVETPDLAPLAARIEQIEQDLGTLRRAAASGPAPTPSPEALTARLAALEQAVAARPAAAPMPAGPAVDPEAVAALQASMAALRRDEQARIQTLADETARLRTVGRGVSLVYALGRLRSALDRGGPYGPSLAVVDDHFKAIGLADDPAIARALATLAGHAESGLRAQAQLSAAFAPVALAVVKAAAIPPEAGTMDRLLAEAGNLVTIRPVGNVAGDDAAARVARAEAALGANNLGMAVHELEGLDGAALAAAGPWMAEAKARLGALTAADMLDGEIAARFAETE